MAFVEGFHSGLWFAGWCAGAAGGIGAAACALAVVYGFAKAVVER